MDPGTHFGEVVLRLAVSLVLGGALGFEREWHRKPAGLRTHMMVALGSTTFTLAALAILADATDPGASGRGIAMDPIRLVQGLIGGIGFLGAGAIIQGQGKVEGLTTAGSLWFVGAVGLTVGGGYYVIAGAAVVLALVTLIVLGRVAHAIKRHRGEEDGSGADAEEAGS